MDKIERMDAWAKRNGMDIKDYNVFKLYKIDECLSTIIIFLSGCIVSALIMTMMVIY